MKNLEHGEEFQEMRYNFKKNTQLCRCRGGKPWDFESIYTNSEIPIKDKHRESLKIGYTLVRESVSDYMWLCILIHKLTKPSKEQLFGLANDLLF